MNRFFCIPTLFLLFVSSQFAQGQQRDSTWQELMAKGRAAFNNFKAEEATDYLSRALTQMPQGESTLPMRIQALTMRSSAKELRNDIAGALEDAKLTLKHTQMAHRSPFHHTWLRPALSVAKYLERSKRRPEAMEYYALALKIAEADTENALDLTLEVLYLFARAQRQAADWDGASLSLSTYIDLLGMKLGRGHPDLVGPLEDLARCQKNLKDYAGAIESLERWVKIYESVKGKDNGATATGLKTIASCYVSLKQFDQAEKACARWQWVLEQVSRSHPEIINICRLRAKSSLMQGDFAEETKHLREASKRMRALQQPEWVTLGEIERLLAVSLRKQGLLPDAREAIHVAMDLFKEKLRPTDPQRLEGRLERGRIYQAMGQLSKAEKDFEAVLKAWLKIAGDAHPVLLPPLTALMSLKESQKQSDKVKELSAWIARIKQAQEK